MHKLIPFLKFFSFIGLCTFSIDTKNNYINFITYRSNLIYSIIFLILTFFLSCVATLSTLYNHFYCNETYSSIINKITDIISVTSTWFHYYVLLIISIKTRHKHVKFLRKLYIFNKNNKNICDFKISLQTICVIAAYSLIYFVIVLILINVEPRSNFLSYLYGVLILNHIITNFLHEAYLKTLAMGQNQFYHVLVLNRSMKKFNINQLINFLCINDQLERLKDSFCKAFKCNLAIVKLRYFTVAVVSSLAYVINLRNMNDFYIGAFLVHTLKLIVVVYFIKLVTQFDMLGNQVYNILC